MKGDGLEGEGEGGMKEGCSMIIILIVIIAFVYY